MAVIDRAYEAQISVLGSMLIDGQCIPLVLSRLSPEDFTDGTCKATFQAIRKLALEGRPADPVTVVDAMQGGERYIAWVREAMEVTTTAANVAEYIPMVRKAAVRRRVLELSEKLGEADDDGLETLVRQMASSLAAAERMPRMTGQELARDFLARMGSKEKPRYLPWGIPTADRNTYAELGDVILLGGYASSGKTLLSLLMAMAQAKAGYRVGYYSLETKPEKLADRMLASLSKVSLGRIKTRSFSEGDWARFSEAANCVATVCPFDMMRAAGSSVDDITADAMGHGYQIVYVDYVQLLQAPGVRDSDGYARVTAVSQALKTFAQNTNTAVVALAQLTRPKAEDSQSEKKRDKPNMPTMYAFKESGQLEQDADVAFLVFPSEMGDNDSARFFRIAKNKEGRRPEPVKLAFRGDIQTMVELEPEPDRSVAREMSERGNAAKQANRAAAREAQFREARGRDGDDPFE